MSSVAPPSSAAEALGMLKAAMGYLAAADATAMAAGTQAQCLRALEQVNSMGTAARSSILAAFTAAQGYTADADYSPRAWLIHKLRVTKGAAVAYTAWVRRRRGAPAGRGGAGGGGDVGVVRPDDLPVDRQAPGGLPPGRGCDLADGGAGGRGPARPGRAGRGDLRPVPAGGRGPGKDREEALEDRSVRLETTFEGAGVLTGDLTPECAAVVGAVLDALSAPAGAEDTRSQAQRYHDGLQEAMRRLVAAGLLPERAGQPVKVLAHISLADLMVLDGSSALQEEWTANVRAAWAARRAAASVGGGDGGAWLDGDAAAAMACDAAMTPVVTGEVNPAALEDLVRLCADLDRLRHHGTSSRPVPALKAAPAPATATATATTPHVGTGGGQGAPRPDTTRAWEALEQAIIGKAVDLVSGPGGLAGFLRRRQLGARLGGPSLPLDVGVSRDIPAAIRRAVILRDQHCRWTGGCDQPAAACEVHHLTHKADGGKTSVRDCILFCTFHHQVVIHQMGWTVVLNPDGTTTAWNRDKTKILRSHSPPAGTG